VLHGPKRDGALERASGRKPIFISTKIISVKVPNDLTGGLATAPTGVPGVQKINGAEPDAKVTQIFF